MWGISWYGDALRTGVDPAVYPLAFYPGGWQLATFGQSVGPALFLAMLPLHWIAGAAFAYQSRRPADLRAGFRGHACARWPVHGTVGRDGRGVAVHILGLSLVPDPRPPELLARLGLPAVDDLGAGMFSSEIIRVHPRPSASDSLALPRRDRVGRSHRRLDVLHLDRRHPAGWLAAGPPAGKTDRLANGCDRLCHPGWRGALAFAACPPRLLAGQQRHRRRLA